MDEMILTVGEAGADIPGFTNTHIQCAVDRIALLGGGTVVLTGGVFAMADALHLRTRVTVRGSGAATVLRKNPMKESPIATYLGYGHTDVVVADPDLFSHGDGIIIGDDKAMGFYQTTGTLVRREGGTWFTTRPFAHDYHPDAHGFVRTLYPLVDAVDVEHAAVEDLVLDGNESENGFLNGCRGGAFFAHRSNRVAARRVTARRFRGEGFSFQTCDHLELDSCTAESCAGNGFHPGSGSNCFRIHGCTARGCAGCGLFYCLRVRDSLLEDCLFEDNGQHGVSVGERDTGHVNRRLTLRHNGGAGFFFRATTAALAAHDTVIEQCVLEENAAASGEAEIVLQSPAGGVRVAGNRIRRRADKPGILVRPEMPAFESRDNVIEPAGPDAVRDMRSQ